MGSIARVGSAAGRRLDVARLLGWPWLPLGVGWLLAVVLVGSLSPLVGLLVALGFGGAFVAGLVGVGGAIVMIPLLLYVPPALGLDSLAIHTVAGITIVQVAAAALAGLGGHLPHVDRRLFVAVGGPMIGGSLTGGVLSAAVDPAVLRAVFAILATLAAVSMLGARGRLPEPRADGSFRLGPAAAIGGAVGLLGGLVGAGGAFVLVPLLVHGLRLPLRTVIGTSLAVVASAALSGLLGKALTGQIEWSLAAALVAGALPGGRLGAAVSRRTRPRWLAFWLGLLTAAVAARMWFDLARLG